MPTRRRFLGSLFAATATLPALKSDALARILPATRHVDGRSAEDVAQDEDFWRQIQAAFDIDRGMINLNNGGVAPSPRVVNAAFQRYRATSPAPANKTFYWEPYATSHLALDADAAIQEEVRNAARTLLEAVRAARVGRQIMPGKNLTPPRQK